MKSVDIKDVDLNNSFFHFTLKDNMDSIKTEGLRAKIGDASKLKDEEKPRVYMSKGGKGIIEIKNSFIHEIKKLRICDIPQEYRPYFEIDDYSQTEQVSETAVYDAMERRFKDEVYFLIDAQEGEDYIIEDFYPEELSDTFRHSSCYRDVKGKAGHDIDSSKISLITTENGNTAFNIVEYLYGRLLENARKNGKDDVVKSFNSDLDAFFEYVKNKRLETAISLTEQQTTTSEINKESGKIREIQQTRIQQLTSERDEIEE
ncbi:MAG: hypothetical protein K6B70_02965 [Clostridia bacterium]|nr:hypothetical protein [Clostridia bacterium]